VLLIPHDITPARLEKRLRALPVPIIARVSQDRVIIDPRTVSAREIPILTDGILAAFRAQDESE